MIKTLDDTSLKKSWLCSSILKTLDSTSFGRQAKRNALPTNANHEHKLGFCLYIKTTFQLRLPLQPDQVRFLQNRSSLSKASNHVNHPQNCVNSAATMQKRKWKEKWQLDRRITTHTSNQKSGLASFPIMGSNSHHLRSILLDILLRTLENQLTVFGIFGPWRLKLLLPGRRPLLVTLPLLQQRLWHEGNIGSSSFYLHILAVCHC